MYILYIGISLSETIIINYRWFDVHVAVLVIPLFCSVHQCGTLANVVSSTGSGMSDQQPCLSEHVN